MIIDAHGHVDEYAVLGWMDGPDKVVSLMDRAGIDKMCITTYGEEPLYPAIEKLVEYVRKYPDRFLGFVRINPKAGEKRALELLRYAFRFTEIRGLKMHPVSNNTKPYNPICLKMFRLAAEHDRPVFYHCGDKVGAQPFEIERGARLCPETVFICHMGGFFHGEDALIAAERCPNLYLDTSSVPYVQMLRRAVEQLGSERIVFASDNPAGDPVSEVFKVRSLQLSEAEEDNIFWRNMNGLLHLGITEDPI